MKDYVSPAALWACEIFFQHTVSEVLQVDKLITPLCKNSYGIFEEGHDDQEASNEWEISAQSICQFLTSKRAHQVRVV